MRRTKKLFGGIFLVLIAFCLALMPQRASSRSVVSEQQVPNAEPVPAFHAAPPTGQLPATLSPSLFTDPLVQNAYRLAAHVKKILYRNRVIATATAARATAACLIVMRAGTPRSAGLAFAKASMCTNNRVRVKAPRKFVLESNAATGKKWTSKSTLRLQI